MEIMRRLGYDKFYPNASRIMDEIASVTPQYGGISYDRLENEGLQWPCPTKDHPGTKYLHKDAIARGKGLFYPVEHIGSAETKDEEYPFILTTGRILYHYHTRSMTGREQGLNRIAPHSFIEINESTANRLGFRDGEIIKVTSRRGSVEVAVKVTDILDEDVVFMPFHYAKGAANYLTNQPMILYKNTEYKVATVKLEKWVKN